MLLPLDFFQKSRGNNMKDHKTKKNNPACKKNPLGVGQPPSLATVTQAPTNFCISLYVSGLASKKKIRVVYNAYFAFKA